jgi:hypothetical protein
LPKSANKSNTDIAQAKLKRHQMKLKLMPVITCTVLLAAATPFVKAVAAPGQQLAQPTTQQGTQQRTGRPNQLKPDPRTKRPNAATASRNPRKN